ncbi:MAG: hypothetical protein WCD53_30215 [Microcoleus sp.]
MFLIDTSLETYLQEQDYIESTPNTWVAAARIYYDLQAPWVNG